MQARVVTFGIQIYDDMLYHGTANQHFPAYSSLYLFDFLSFNTLNNEFFVFVKDFCETVQARVVRFGMHVNNDVLYCGIASRPSPGIPSCICLIYFLSVLQIMTIFVKDFCKTVQARVVIFCMLVDNDVLYCWIANQSSPVYSSIYVSDFLSFHTLNNECFSPKISVEPCKLEQSYFICRLVMMCCTV